MLRIQGLHCIRTHHHAYAALLSCTVLHLANISGLVVYHRQPPATVPAATAAAVDSNECSPVCSNHVPFAALKVSLRCAPGYNAECTLVKHSFSCHAFSLLASALGMYAVTLLLYTLTVSRESNLSFSCCSAVSSKACFLCALDSIL
jgi:hypothetical protein